MLAIKASKFSGIHEAKPVTLLIDVDTGVSAQRVSIDLLLVNTEVQFVVFQALVSRFSIGS